MSASEGHVKKRRVSKKHHYGSQPDNSGDEKRDVDIEKRRKHRDVAEHNVTLDDGTPSEESEEFPFLLSESGSEKSKKIYAKTGEGKPEMTITDYYIPVRKSEGFTVEKKKKRKDNQAEFEEVYVHSQSHSERKKRKKQRESCGELYSACETETDSRLSDAGGSSSTQQGMEGHAAKGKQRASADDNRDLASRTSGKKNSREAKSVGKRTSTCIESSMSDQHLDNVSSWEAETNQTCTPGSARKKKKQKPESAESSGGACNLLYSPVRTAGNRFSLDSSRVSYSEDREQEGTYRDGPGAVFRNELDGFSSENKGDGVTEGEEPNLPKKKKQRQLLRLSGTSESLLFTPPSVDGSPERTVSKDRASAESLHSFNETKKDDAPKNRKSSGEMLLSSGSAASVPAFSSSRNEAEYESESLLDCENGNSELCDPSVSGVITAEQVHDSTSRSQESPGAGSKEWSSDTFSAAVLEAAFYAAHERRPPPDPAFLEYLNGTHGYPAIHQRTKPSAEAVRLYEEEQGLSLDYGKYTTDEDRILLRNVHDIAAYYGIRFPYMIVGHCGDYSSEVQKEVKKLVKEHNLMRMLGRGLPCRTLHSAYMRARILLDPQIEVAKNTPTKKMQKQVERLYAQMGPKWTLMAQRLGLTAEQCRSVFRHGLEKKTFATGVWTQEEDDLLQQAMEEQSSDKIVKLSAIDWQKVSKMVGRRTAQQCRRRWTLLQLKPDVSSAMRKWSRYDTIHLIWRMHKLNPPRSSAVDWDKLVEYFPWAQSASIPRYYWQSTVNKYLSSEDRADFQSKVKNLYEKALPRLLNKYGNGRTVSEIVKLSKSSNTVPLYPQDDD